MKKMRKAKIAVPKQAEKTKAELTRAQEAMFEAKRQLQLAVDGAELGTWKADQARGVYDADMQAKRLHGLAYDAPLDRTSMLAAVDPDDRERVVQRLGQALSDSEPFSSEYRVLLADGSLLWVASRASIVTENVLHGIVFDITHRKHAEELLSTQHQLALKLTEARGLEETLRMCLNAAIVATGMPRGGIYLREKETGALRLAYHAGLSPEFVQAVEHYPADSPHAAFVMRGVPMYTRYRDVHVPVTLAEWQEGLQSIAVIPICSSQSIVGCVNLASHAEKMLKWEERSTVETIVSMVGYFIMRARAEEALRESEKKYRQLYEMESDTLLLVDRETYQILDVNEATVQLYGYDREELLNMRSIDLSAEPDKTLGAIKAGIADVPIRWHRKKDGTVFPVEIAGAYFFLGGKSVYLAAIRDNTERVRLEEVLRDSESQYRHLFEAGSDSMILFEKESCRIMDANMKAIAVYGNDLNELLAKSYLDISAEPEESRAAI
jgi:PAS domain S-box-containing protein